MIQECCICHRIIKDGSAVGVMMYGIYKEINSECSWALMDDDLHADVKTLFHKDCSELVG
jgi:hypothetical protein